MPAIAFIRMRTPCFWLKDVKSHQAFQLPVLKNLEDLWNIFEPIERPLCSLKPKQKALPALSTFADHVETSQEIELAHAAQKKACLGPLELA